MQTHIAKPAWTFAAALALTGSALAAPAVSSGSPAPASNGVCAGVKSCHRVATIDVDGDRRADQVGWHQLDKFRVEIRVRTVKGRTLRHTVNVRYWWKGGEWGGAAWIDGRPGAELLVGSLMGAHTPFYTMLTFRKGHLAVEKSPAVGAYGTDRWAIDSSLMAYAGWDRNVGPKGRITMTQRVASRNGDGVEFKGHDVRYAWTKGHWKQVNRKQHWYKNARKASKIGGWHVWHLERFPGL